MSQTAGGIGSRLYGQYGRHGQIGREFMTTGNVSDGPAIGGHIAVKLPVAAKNVFEQHGVGACWLPVDGVVSAHDRVGMGLGDRRAEGRQIGVPEIVWRD